MTVFFCHFSTICTYTLIFISLSQICCFLIFQFFLLSVTNILYQWGNRWGWNGETRTIVSDKVWKNKYDAIPCGNRSKNMVISTHFLNNIINYSISLWYFIIVWYTMFPIGLCARISSSSSSTLNSTNGLSVVTNVTQNATW